MHIAVFKHFAASIIKLTKQKKVDKKEIYETVLLLEKYNEAPQESYYKLSKLFLLFIILV